MMTVRDLTIRHLGQHVKVTWGKRRHEGTLFAIDATAARVDVRLMGRARDLEEIPGAVTVRLRIGGADVQIDPDATAEVLA